MIPVVIDHHDAVVNDDAKGNCDARKGIQMQFQPKKIVKYYRHQYVGNQTNGDQ